MAMNKGWHWGVFVGGLMAVVIGANLILIYFATTDPSFAVEEDYYQKALHWDDKRAQDRANAELGWTVELDVGRERAADGSVQVVVRLLDAEGQAVRGAGVDLEAFHNARAAWIHRVQLRENEEGAYSAALPARRPGLWEFRLNVVRDEQRFTHKTVKELGS